MIIDFHTHVAGTKRTAEHVVAHHRAHGGGKSVVLPIAPANSTAMALEGFGLDAMRTELTLAAYQQYPDEIVPFCHVDPLAPDVLDQIRRYHAMGCVGFGEHKVRLPCDHPVSMEIYRLCGELGMPVLLHFQYGMYNYNFEDFEQVLRACPETTFVAHAQAWWANVSAAVPRDYTAPNFNNYPRYQVVPGGLADRWLAEYPNLYGDLSAGSGLNAISRDRQFGEEFVRRHSRKLLWATDCFCFDGKGDFGEFGGDKQRPCFAARSLPLLREYCGSDDEAYADVTYRNAERVLGR